MRNYRWCSWLQIELCVQFVITEIALWDARANLAWQRSHPQLHGAYNVLGAQIWGGVVGSMSLLVAALVGIVLIFAAIFARNLVSGQRRWGWVATALIVPAMIGASLYWWRYPRWDA
ncbi:hypothetical protein [Limnoglobus roseus]|uniref:Uncharacterized protein n=1 Tax=Limnoglobus roseus TaxID=2598579 RepID=A0A5C1ATP4_9BACT|nr:hypothetical protein [Limnoglobus roseus]QEL20972.1 hypothetical protein PX52LOC_08100 [Limnoglobus roseus]